MKRHIEFLGIPGSGKTTAYKAFLDAARQRKEHAYSLDEAFYQALKGCHHVSFLRVLANMLPFHLGHRLVGRFPKTTDDLLYQSFQKFVVHHRELSGIVQAYQLTSAESSQDLGLITFLWLLELFSKYQFVHDGLPDDSSLVLDEGFCQRIISLFAYSGRENTRALQEKIARYLDSIPLPNALVVLAVPSELAEERMQRRGWPLRMQTMTHTQRTRFFTRATTCIDLAVAYLQTKPIDIVTFENTNTRAECLQKIPEIFQSLLLVLPHSSSL